MMKGVRLRGEKKEIRDGNSSLIPPECLLHPIYRYVVC
jgi:hypothetical protein